MIEECYHGTQLELGNSILKNNFMKSSVGEDQWLGDGVYLYKKVEYAFRWICIKYKKQLNKGYSEIYKNIYSKYMILAVNVEIDDKRVFNLDEYDNKICFFTARESLEKKKKESETYKNNEIPDGVIINYLFNELNYSDKYDAIMVTYPIKIKSDSGSLSHLNYIPEMQICIKNYTVIKDIRKYNDNFVKDETKRFMEQYKIIKFGDTKKKLKSYDRHRRKYVYK